MTAEMDLFRDRSSSPNRKLNVFFHYSRLTVELIWENSNEKSIEAKLIVGPTGYNELTWDLEIDGKCLSNQSNGNINRIRLLLQNLANSFPVELTNWSWVGCDSAGKSESLPVPADPLEGIAQTLRKLERKSRPSFEKPSKELPSFEDPLEQFERLDRAARSLERRRRRELEIQRRIENAHREKIIEVRRAQKILTKIRRKSQTPPTSEPPQTQPIPAMEVVSEISIPNEVTHNSEAREGLVHFLRRERATSWWIANQTDELICLPHSHIEHHNYQVRAALRAIGALRGRALLCDEVGLGKTIEAGLVLKELVMRGLVKRFLVITTPSLVDQWVEELRDKFDLEASSTNRLKPRDQEFWKTSPGIVSSLHTLKSPQRLAIASQMKWDLVIVDEAHYLRNRTSASWQAINQLPRQYMLLLTATPIQNGLDDLYSLVTLLRPGQLPAPAEFRKRFVDKENPRRVNDPDGLRDLLREVMIRNTRANAGIDLPPRRAETILFEADEQEKAFWRQWEDALRIGLARISAPEAAMRGRLLLQASGSSPSAWRDMISRSGDLFDPSIWLANSAPERSWESKWRPLAVLAARQGGIVIFTQFRLTQQSLAEVLRNEKLPVFAVDGSVPASKRTEIVDAFRKQGGALILTRSGSEGRNLQFCHQMVNFDLPWNPMEIEQRIGRLHRMGQKQRVEILNLVRTGSLQEHLLFVLQEKLNLFELTVGETGLVLGDRYSGDEFSVAILEGWKRGEEQLARHFAELGEELVAARSRYREIQETDQALFERDFEML